MARIAELELERLKVEVSIARLVEGSGIKLEKRGRDLVGPCPFDEIHKVFHFADPFGPKGLDLVDQGLGNDGHGALLGRGAHSAAEALACRAVLIIG